MDANWLASEKRMPFILFMIVVSFSSSHCFHPQDYAEAATIHGIGYIGERGQVEGMMITMKR